MQTSTDREAGSAFPLLPFEVHTCDGDHATPTPASWVAHIHITAGIIATAHLCDVCKAMV